jgi:hypothetical protein
MSLPMVEEFSLKEEEEPYAGPEAVSRIPPVAPIRRCYYYYYLGLVKKAHLSAVTDENDA